MKKTAPKIESNTKRNSSKTQEADRKGHGATLNPPTYGIRHIDQPSDIFLQTKSEAVTSENDKYEQEADKFAYLATQKSSDQQAGNTTSDQSKQERRISSINSARKSDTMVSPNVASTLQSSLGNGSSLATNVRAEMEAAFGADFSQVRIHTDNEAVNMNKEIGAKAFTYGSDIYFNQGMYAPGTQAGQFLLAHELTHTIQQQSTASIQMASADASSGESSSLLDDIIGFFVKYADDIPGYALFTTIIEYDVLRGKRKKRTPENFLQGIMGLVPGGNQLYLGLSESGIIQKAFDWLQGEVEKLNLSVDRIKAILKKLWKDTSYGDLFRGGIVDILDKAFSPLLRDVIQFGKSVLDQVFAFLKDTLVDPLVELAKETKGYELLTKVLGRDPISGEEVQATTAEILEDFLILLGKEKELEEMKSRGTLKKTADWLDEQVQTFFSLLDELKGVFLQIWNNFELEDWLQDPLGKLNEVVDKVKGPVLRFVAFGWEVAKKVLQFIKDSLLRWLGTFLKENLRGFKLLTVILGKDPITNEVVERTGENLILGFLSLILPDERIQEIQQTGVVQQTIDWILAKVDELGMTWRSIVQLFVDIWNSFTIEDIIKPVQAFMRVMQKFGEPIVKIFNFIKAVVIKVVEVILQIMQFPVDVVKSIIEKASQAFEDIKRDPVQFFLNLLNAIKLGFTQFFENIGTHLWNGVKAWLFKQLEKAQIKPPEDLSFQSVLGLVMDILGISTERIFAKIEKKIGKEKMDKLRSLGQKAMGIWEFVNDIITGGPAALWEKIQDQLSNLWDTVLGFVQDWIMEKVVEKVTARLLSMLDPTGIMAVVNSVIALYDTIRSAIEYFKEMLEIVNSFVTGIAEIARGSLNRAANFLEGALGQGIPVAIGFLANIIGLDGLADRLREILDKIRLKVDQAMDWLIDKAIALGSGLLEVGKEAIAKLKNWWKAKKEFKAQDGERHSIYFQGSGSNATLMVASKKQPFATFISLIDVSQEPEKKEPKVKALAIAKEIDAEKNKGFEKGLSPQEREAAEQTKATRIDKLLEELAKETVKLFGKTLPKWMEPEYGPLINEIGKFMKIKPLTVNAKPNGSKPTTSANKTYDKLNKRRAKGGASYYVRGHLLNEKLGGPGQWKNMTPLSREGNSKHEREIEAILKAAVSAKAIVEYIVTPDYKSRGDASALKKKLEKIHGTDTDATNDLKEIVDAEDMVPEHLLVEAHILEAPGLERKQKIYKKEIKNPIDRSPDSYFLATTTKKFVPVKINIPTLGDIKRLKEVDADMNDTLALQIFSVLAKEKPFRRYNILAKILSDNISAVKESKVLGWYEKGYLTLSEKT